jgi:hypothetical protein
MIVNLFLFLCLLRYVWLFNIWHWQEDTVGLNEPAVRVVVIVNSNSSQILNPELSTAITCRWQDVREWHGRFDGAPKMQRATTVTTFKNNSSYESRDRALCKPHNIDCCYIQTNEMDLDSDGSDYEAMDGESSESTDVLSSFDPERKVLPIRDVEIPADYCLDPCTISVKELQEIIQGCFKKGT